MEKITLNVPSLYADHHVMTVREVLQQLEGIEEIYASSAWKQISLAFDPDKVDPAAIEKTLNEAGYPVEGEEMPILIERNAIGRDPQWTKLTVRTAQTNPRDREMVRQFHGN
jgi:copper chaperone CopZ